MCVKVFLALAHLELEKELGFLKLTFDAKAHDYYYIHLSFSSYTASVRCAGAFSWCSLS